MRPTSGLRRGGPSPRPGAIPYHADRDALYRPGSASDFFTYGDHADDASLCAEMSRVAYVPQPARLRDYLTRAGFGLVAFEERDGTEALVAADGRRLVLAFRGTEDLRDVRTDVRFVPTGWPQGGRVHRGFAEAFELVWDRVEAQLSADGRRVLFTGHSLGGALATLAATRRAPDAMYTFGSPMVGNGDFAELLRGVEHRRFVNCADVVPRVPPEFLDFRHTGTLCYLDRNGELRVDPPAAEVDRDRLMAASRYLTSVAWRPGKVKVRELADHAPINYLSGALGRRAREVV